MIRIGLFPPRCYVLGRRVHHGLLALVLLLSDLHDWRVWLKDFARHPEHRGR